MAEQRDVKPYEAEIERELGFLLKAGFSYEYTYDKGSDSSCVYISYKTVDKNYVSNFAAYLKKEAQVGVTRTFHNKTQKNGKSSIGVYYYKK